MLTQHNREHAYTARPSHVAVAAELAATVHHSVMYRTALVHVIALVRAAAGVEHAQARSDKQCGFVVRYTERTSKQRRRLAVHHLTVGEKHRIGCRKLLAHLTAVAHETSGQLRSVGHLRAFSYYEVTGYHAPRHRSRSLLARQHCSILKHMRAVYLSALAYLHILYLAAVAYLRSVAYRHNAGLLSLYIFVYDSVIRLDEVFVAFPEALKMGQLRRQFVEYPYGAAAVLVEQRQLRSVAETRHTVHAQETNVLYLHAFAYPYLAAELTIAHIIGGKVICDLH